jgi:hypothetical protein
MKIIGPNATRPEIELDPARAYRRGRALDAMLRTALPPPARGVHRGTFATLARIDEGRMIAAARRIEDA